MASGIPRSKALKTKIFEKWAEGKYTYDELGVIFDVHPSFIGQIVGVKYKEYLQEVDKGVRKPLIGIKKPDGRLHFPGNTIQVDEVINDPVLSFPEKIAKLAYEDLINEYLQFTK